MEYHIQIPCCFSNKNVILLNSGSFCDNYLSLQKKKSSQLYVLPMYSMYALISLVFIALVFFFIITISK